VVIERTDRVAAVLARDEELVEVFVAAAPAFSRLRNPGLRRVMARLVTVEQAAGIAGIDADALVEALNQAFERGPAGEEALPSSPSSFKETHYPVPDTLSKPEVLERISPDLVVDCDVREDLRTGKEPFARIMAARRSLPEGGVLLVRAIFEPVPLYRVMAQHGLDHWTQKLGEEDWRVWFFAAQTAAPTAEDETADERESSDDDEDGAVVIDVRGLEPPEPMVRTLAALETLPRGQTLVQLNVRIPQFLLPKLEERGFVYEVREQGPDLVRLFIRHGAV
jgi:uncharacterized protein (DUF2249 family)